MEQKQSLVVGLWKFSSRVNHEDLMQLAGEWAKDENYVELYLRDCGNDLVGVGFAYKSDGRKETQELYFFETGAMLKKRFGGNFIAWDFSTTQDLIKGYESLK